MVCAMSNTIGTIFLALIPLLSLRREGLSELLCAGPEWLTHHDRLADVCAGD